MAMVRQDKTFDGNAVYIDKHIDSSAAPAVTDDIAHGFRPGCIWVRQSTAKAYILITAAAGAADWQILN